MLKSLGYVELRIDEMRPRLLDFGSNFSETKNLLDAHRDLISRLRSKQDQVEQLLAGADKLVTEQKTEDGIIVYEAMAESLGVAWRELNRQLDLRGYILEDAIKFYQEADNHAQIVSHINDVLRHALSGNPQAVQEAQNGFNHLLDVTSSAVELGSSIIKQICVLGNLADNAERPAETANACLLIEKVMLKLAQEWESVESVWNQEKEKLGHIAGQPQQQRDTLSDQLTEIENWLRNAQAQVAHGADASILSSLIQEAKHQSEVLKHLFTEFQSQRNEASALRCQNLQSSVEQFIRQIEERSQLGSRIQQFIQNADSMLHQMDKMEVDLSNASAAIAGELGPLARQKCRKVIEEGQQIIRIEHNEQVATKLSQLQSRLQQIEELAKYRIQVGSQLLKSQISNLTTWLRDTAEPFLASNGNLGNDYNSASEFVTRHKQFATEVINKEHEVNTVLNRAHELNAEDRRHLTDFEHRYESLKQTLENRIQLGANFQQVQKFSRELDHSFETLSNLLNVNRDFSNENVVQQMNNVFHMIQETFQQERHQGEKFVSNAKFLANHDVHLNADQAIDSVRQIITSHEEKIQSMNEKWQNWEKVKRETKVAIQTVEEIQMWQVDTFEIIRNLETAADRATTEEQKEEVRERLEQVIRQMPQQLQKIQEAHRLVVEKGSDDSRLRVQKTAQTQADIQSRVKQIQNKLTQVSETYVEEGSKQIHQQIPPQRQQDFRDSATVETVIETQRIQKQQPPPPSPKHFETVETVVDTQHIQHRQQQPPPPKHQRIQDSQTETIIDIQRIQKQPPPPPSPKHYETVETIVDTQHIQHRQPQPPPHQQQRTIETTIQEDTQRFQKQQPPPPQRQYFGDSATVETVVEEDTYRTQHHQPPPQPSPQQQFRTTTEITTEERTKKAHQKAPRLVTELRDAQIDEGSRFQFAARIEAEPEPKITWTKDGMDVKTNVDYRQSFLNGTATLTIEETFIEDSATYKIRVENPLGSAESSARLTVKSKSQLGGPEAQKPHFVKQLQNVTVSEGETAKLDCVVIAQPEPKIVWYKEEETIQESQRIKLDFQGDHCSLTIHKTTPSDSGLYKVSARNQAGETQNFCQIYVQPATPTKKTPPATLPKPKTPIPEAPAFIPSLVNQTVEEGQKALFQVRTTGSPTPKVTWKFKEQPIKSTETMKIQQEEETGWSRLIIDNVGPQHTGLYTVEAINESGEARSGATLIVTPPGGQTGALQQRSVTMMQSEGFWSDGAYTAGTPTPPPIPQHRNIKTTIEEYQQQDVGELGYSSIANAPEYVRPFHKEYTVNEGEKVQVDCLMVGNPRPKVYWFFNDKPIKSNYQFAEFLNVGDTYSIVFTPAKLENAGFYKMTAENIKGKTESSTVIHVRPRSLIPQPKASRKPHIIEHQKIIEHFGATDYSEIVPQKHRSGLSTPPPAKRLHGMNQQPLSQSYHSVSQVTTVGEAAKFDGIVIGTPAPEIQWSKDGVPITKQSHPHIDFSNIGGRISLSFKFTSLTDSGKYMASAMSSGGIATSSAQLVVRPKTVAPDFVKRLISEEVMEGDRLHWTIKVSGDPLPTVTWLRDGQVIPHCDEVQIIDEGNGNHSLIIPKVQLIDSGQFTATAVNQGGEARSSADLVVRQRGQEPGTFFHITKVTQERQIKGEEVSRDQTFSIENPRATPTKQHQ
uniref:Ig-like domain-containing protein n=1 Tax=Panagrolaimus davidi TaxID=227884 RepID=A0A914RBS0_9BILA